MLAYTWEKDTRVKDVNLEVIWQALLKADEANLIALALYQAFPMYYDDPVAADDGICDKASLSNAEDLPWELRRSKNNVHKPQDNIEMVQAAPRKENPESRAPEKIESPSKRIRQETRQGSDGESEAEEIQEAEKENQATCLMISRRSNTGKMSACSRSRNGLHSKGTRNNCAQGHH